MLPDPSPTTPHSPAAEPRRRRTVRRRRTAAVLAVTLVSGLALSGCATAGSDVVTIQFMQNKPEAVEYFADLVQRFEEENPDIRVVQGNSEAALVPGLIRGTPPDVTTRGWAYASADFAAKGIYADLSDLEAADRVDPAAQELVNSWGQYNGTEVSALPFSLAGAGVIYNEALFDQFGVEVPTTWGEFVAACEVFAANGVTPVYGTYKDSWTLAQGLFDYTTGGLVDVAAFYAPPEDGADPVTRSYTKTFAPAVEKMKTILSYTQKGAATRSYPDGNAAFAHGEAAMYFQGPWALSEINGINPDLQIGTFALPMTNDPADTKARVNVDSALSILRTTEHPAEARRFVEFLMQPEVVEAFNTDHAAFSPLTDAPPQANPQIAGLDPLFKAGRYYQGAFTYMPPAVPAQNYIQYFAGTGNGAGLLRNLDEDTQRVADRLAPSTDN
ncbi:ABC transporter substrate-binding protein [Cryobacterium sp. SO1]|uniref:ABC transporter substrate-binding protein n=1 Tax=Cryobacterium sp. SO1 TaxID=1897061 RepID=UPI0010E0DDF8|nr:ABC transporter substrate-binding protein [Cryobacterium sp. SO1]RZI35444.1 Multiple sugar-binding protein [Cryobacterium sp. SO1]